MVGFGNDVIKRSNMNNITTKGELWFLCLPFSATFLLAVISQSEWADILKYGLYYALLVVPISFACGTFLLKKYTDSIVERIALGYPITILIMSVWLIAAKALGLRTELSIILIAAIALGSIKIFKDENWSNHKNEVIRKRKQWNLIALATIYLLASLVLYSSFTLTTTEPQIGYGSNIYEDTLWTIGNTWSAVRNGLPMVDLRFADINLGYHIGQNLYYGAISLLTGITPIELHLRIGPYYELFFLCISVVAYARVFIGIRNKGEWAVSIPILFAAAEITSFKVGATANVHEVFTNPISLAFGLSSFLLLMGILSRRYCFNSHNNDIPYTYVICLYILAVSTKGLLGVLIPGSIIVLLIVRLAIWRKRIVKQDIALLIGMGLILYILKITMFTGAGSWVVAPQIEISPVAIRIASKLGLAEAVQNTYVVIGPISRLIRFLFHVLIWNWITISIGISLLVFNLVNAKEQPDLKIGQMAISLITVCSILYGINIMDNYWANLYYYKYAFAILSMQLGIICSSYIYYLQRSFGLRKGIVLLAAIAGTITTLMPSLIELNAHIRPIGTESWKSNRGMEETTDRNLYLDKAEYDGLVWMRNNLDERSIIASDRKNKEGWSGDYTSSVWFNYSAFSGLQFYNEGDAFNYEAQAVANERWEAIQALLSVQNRGQAHEAWNNISADYLIITKKISPMEFEKNYLGELIYGNRGIKVIAKPLK